MTELEIRKLELDVAFEAFCLHPQVHGFPLMGRQPSGGVHIGCCFFVSTAGGGSFMVTCAHVLQEALKYPTIGYMDEGRLLPVPINIQSCDTFDERLDLGICRVAEAPEASVSMESIFHEAINPGTSWFFCSGYPWYLDELTDPGRRLHVLRSRTFAAEGELTAKKLLADYPQSHFFSMQYRRRSREPGTEVWFDHKEAMSRSDKRRKARGEPRQPPGGLYPRGMSGSPVFSFNDGSEIPRLAGMLLAAPALSNSRHFISLQAAVIRTELLR